MMSCSAHCDLATEFSDIRLPVPCGLWNSLESPPWAAAAPLGSWLDTSSGFYCGATHTHSQLMTTCSQLQLSSARLCITYVLQLDMLCSLMPHGHHQKIWWVNWKLLKGEISLIRQKRGYFPHLKKWEPLLQRREFHLCVITQWMV